MQLHLVCSYFGSCKNLIVKYKVNENGKDKEMIKYLFSLLRTTAFFLCLFFGLVLNHSTLSATAAYETYKMPIVKECNRFVFFQNVNCMDRIAFSCIWTESFLKFPVYGQNIRVCSCTGNKDTILFIYGKIQVRNSPHFRAVLHRCFLTRHQPKNQPRNLKKLPDTKRFPLLKKFTVGRCYCVMNL